MMKDAETAEHEASHALMAWISGARLISLSISGPVAERGYYAFCKSAPDFNKDHESRAMALMCESLAPGVVDEYRAGKLSGGSLNDVLELMKELSHGGGDAFDMAMTAGNLLRQYPDDPWQAAAEFLKKYSEPVKEILSQPESQAAFKALAEKLKKQKRLSGYEAALCLEKSWPGALPDGVLPAGGHMTDLVKSTSPEDELQAARRLVRVAFEGLTGFESLEKPAEIVLQALFQLSEF